MRSFLSQINFETMVHLTYSIQLNPITKSSCICFLTGFSIEGPSQAKIDCKDNGDGTADITYWPTAPGEYAVHIHCNDEDIPKSPYMAQIQPATKDFDPLKVRQFDI